MKTETLKNGLSVKGNLIGLGIILLLSLLAYIWCSQPTAQAQVETLQQSVEMAQADYDLSQTQAKDALIQACESWKNLAKAKIDLAKELKIPSTLTEASRDCLTVSVPASFL